MIYRWVVQGTLCMGNLPYSYVLLTLELVDNDKHILMAGVGW